MLIRICLEQELNEGKFRSDSSIRDLKNKVALLEEVNEYSV